MQEEGVKGDFLGCVWRNTGSKLVSARKARHKQEPSRPAGWRFVGLATAMTAAIGPAAGPFGPIWAGHSVVDRWTSAVANPLLNLPRSPLLAASLAPNVGITICTRLQIGFPLSLNCLVVLSLFLSSEAFRSFVSPVPESPVLDWPVATCNQTNHFSPKHDCRLLRFRN